MFQRPAIVREAGIAAAKTNVMNKPLFLILKKEWFEAIESGQKTIEYREYTEYWLNRLSKPFTEVIFQLGYSSSAKRIQASIQKIEIEQIKHPFFGEKKVNVFAIYICNPRAITNGKKTQNKRRQTDKV